MNWIVVRTDMKWPCAIVKEDDVPKEGISFGMSADAAKRLEVLIKDCDSVDEIHNRLDEHGIAYEEINDVATVVYGDS